MNIATVNTNFGNHIDSRLFVESKSILQSMTNNANFLNPQPTLTEFADSINNFGMAMAAAQSRDITLIAIRNEKRDILELNLFQMGTYVNLTALGDLPKLVSSGFPLSKPGTASAPIDQPQDLRVVSGTNSGEVVTSVKGVKSARSYLHQYTKGPLTENSVWTSIPCTRRKCLITGLHPTDIVWFRVAAVGVREQIVYSDAVSRVIQ